MSKPETITEIRPLPSDPNLRRVRVGNRTVATLRASDVEALHLEVGVRWSANLQQTVERTAALIAARRAAMNLLGRRQLSRAELVDKLSKKHDDLSIAEQVADELSREGWIDDAAMAAALSDELVRRKAAGPKLLRARLKSRKIDPHLAQSIARSAASPADAFSNALNLAERRREALARQPRHVAARRIAATLARKGYDDDIIQRVLETMDLAGRSEHDS